MFSKQNLFKQRALNFKVEGHLPWYTVLYAYIHNMHTHTHDLSYSLKPSAALLFVLLACLERCVLNILLVCLSILLCIYCNFYFMDSTKSNGLPGWLSGKESNCNAGDVGLIPG